LQAYLALLQKANTFVVVHGLHQWVTAPPSWSVNEGRLVAFEGETLGEDSREPPDLLRFNGEENKLFKLLSLSKVNLGQVASFYDGNSPHRDCKWFDEASLDEVEGVRLGHLYPIPTAWAAMFLDYPNVRTALRRVQALIQSVAIDKVENFKLLAYSMTYACFLLPDSSEATSMLELDWKHLPHVKLNMAWRIKAWKAGKQASSRTEFNEGESADKQEDPPEEIDPFLALFGGDRQPRIIFPGPQTSRAPSWGSRPYGARVQLGWGQHPAHPTAMPFRHPTTKPTTASRGGARAGRNPTAQHGQGLPAAAQQILDIKSFMATMLRAQTDSQLVIAAASHTNMVAFHTATAQASAASGGKDARMTVAKTSILRACIGQVLAISQVYKEMEMEGATSETVARILRRLLQPVKNTLHKLNILVTPHLVLTVKNLSFSANGNKTHSGCTKGITIFVVPWKTQNVMNEEEEEHGGRDDSILSAIQEK
jgi:hypothetical protein